MKSGDPGFWLWCIIPAYLVSVLLIGWVTRSRVRTANQYLNASFSLPTWAVALSFLAYNCGSIEILAMSAMAAQYGVQALHFYWIGGIPGMIFMAVVVLPLYVQTGARNLPEYLAMRFGPNVRLISAGLSAISTAAFSGITLYALAEFLHVILGWSLLSGILVTTGVVFAYVLTGGIHATVYTSVLQFLVTIGGLAPLVFKTVHLTVATFAQRPERWHLWKPLPVLSPHAALDQFGVIAGLGFVSSFSYWCTDFVMIQRALGAKSLESARKVPIFAGFGKMVIAFLIVLPGVAAPALLGNVTRHTFNEVLPNLMLTFYGPFLLALGAAALMAGLMAGLAGNITGFSALWTEEIYRSRLNPGRSEKHYIGVGRLSVLACALLALVGAYATFYFRDLMEFLQMILALFYAPVFAVVLAGVANRKLRSLSAAIGILCGVMAGLAMQAGYWAGGIHFGSQMTADFYTALLNFGVTLFICYAGAFLENRARPAFVSAAPGFARLIRPSRSLVVWSALLLLACAFLSIAWR